MCPEGLNFQTEPQGNQPAGGSSGVWVGVVESPGTSYSCASGLHSDANGFKMIGDLIVTHQSYRRFCEDVHMDENTLTELVDLTRLSASRANLHPLQSLPSARHPRNALPLQHWHRSDSSIRRWGKTHLLIRPQIMDNGRRRKEPCGIRGREGVAASDHNHTGHSLPLGAVLHDCHTTGAGAGPREGAHRSDQSL